MTYDICRDADLGSVSQVVCRPVLKKINTVIDSLSYIQHEHSLWEFLWALKINNLTAIIILPKKRVVRKSDLFPDTK